MTLEALPPIQTRDAQVFPRVSWQQYEKIDQAFESIPGVKFRYLDGALELMPISSEHEEFKTIIRMLVEAYLRTKQIRFYGRGGPTLGDANLGARSEPDESYNIGSRKPYPDLVIEVVFTSGGLDKLEGYQRMGVSEVWFWEDGILNLFALTANGYVETEQSKLLPDFPVDLFCRFVTYHDQFDAVNEFSRALEH
ncbi:MAG: Uma2 family endonuclease [Phormidesmis sp.]